METSSLFVHTLLTRRRDPSTHAYALKSLYFFMPATLALTTSLIILLYMSSTSNIFFVHRHHVHISSSVSGDFLIRDKPKKVFTFHSPESVGYSEISRFSEGGIVLGEMKGRGDTEFAKRSRGMYNSDTKIFHDIDAFLENYKGMNRSLKVFDYPHKQDDPFANVLLPVDFEPNGNYASESYFKKVLVNSHFCTKDPSKADLFFLPFSIARLRHDPRVGVSGIQDFVKDYITNISREYPFWNSSGGADHFYVACHSIGRSAMEKAVPVASFPCGL